MNLTAKPVIKNKFWIVENNGEKVATIQATDQGVVLVKDQRREPFVNLKSLSSKYDIRISKDQLRYHHDKNTLYGYPITGKSYNAVFNVKKKLPFFTKTSKSKSFYCAGYYVIKVNDEWKIHFCPKSITVKRYPYYGPYATHEEATTRVLMCADIGDK